MTPHTYLSEIPKYFYYNYLVNDNFRRNFINIYIYLNGRSSRL